MPDKITPAEKSKGLTITEALGYLEKKYAAGDYQKVIDGCSDIVHVDPQNKKAQSLLQKAQKKMQPQKNLMTIKPKTIAIAALIVIVVIGAIWQWTKKETPVITHDRTNTENADNTPEGNARRVRNEQRLANLTKIENALKEAYKRDHEYPKAASFSETLTNGGFIDDLPRDPLNGTKDADGTIFSYMYAVYDNVKAPQQEYILSGVFEENNGKNIVWTLGAKTTDHPDYRDDSLDNVTTIE